MVDRYLSGVTTAWYLKINVLLEECVQFNKECKRIRFILEIKFEPALPIEIPISF